MKQRSFQPLWAGIWIITLLAISVAAFRQAGGTPSATGSGRPDPGCVGVVVASSSEKSAQLIQMAAAFDATHPKLNGTCVDVRVNDMASGAAEAALAKGWDQAVDGPQPDVWSPAATSWIVLLRSHLRDADRRSLLPDTTPSLMQSPLVIGMPKPMAEAMGWPNRPIGWADLFAVAQDPSGWGRYGHPEWGSFRLGKTDPLNSTSGLHALVAAYYAGTGNLKSDLTVGDVSQPSVQAFVHGIEASVVHYGGTTNTFLANLRAADQQGQALTYLSAVPLEEKQLVAYDQGAPLGSGPTVKPPTIPLVAVYPADGTLVADHPYVVLNAPWVGESTRKAAAMFLDYLRQPAQQRAFQAAGFRDANGAAGSGLAVAFGIQPAGPKVVDRAPIPEVLTRIYADWSRLRKPARVLFVIDVSGSMSESVGSAGSKLDLVKAAAGAAIGQLGDGDSAGLWIFPEPGGTGPHEVQAIQSLATNRQALKTAIAALQAAGGTPLYTAAVAADSFLANSPDPTAINAVVLLTDGVNDDSNNDLDATVRKLHDLTTEHDGPRLFTIAYGSDADVSALRKLASATRGASYDATNPKAIAKVFAAVISNF